MMLHPSLHAKSLQSCLILHDPVDHSPPGFSVHGILQARILEWVAMPSSRGPAQPRDWTQVSRISGGFFTIWATREVGSICFLWEKKIPNLKQLIKVWFYLNDRSSPNAPPPQIPTMPLALFCSSMTLVTFLMVKGCHGLIQLHQYARFNKQLTIHDILFKNKALPWVCSQLWCTPNITQYSILPN